MFEASIDGEMYDPDRWIEYFAPFGWSNVVQAKSSGFS
jgi:hypothetical protein